MADNPGIRIPSPSGTDGDTFYPPPNTTLPAFDVPVVGHFQPQPTDFHSGDEADSTATKGGSYKKQQNRVLVPLQANPGIRIPGFFEEFWTDRLHIIPTRFDAGNILAPTQSSFTIHNAFRFKSVTFDTQTLVSLSGVTIESGVTPPIVFGAGRSETFVFEIALEGAPTVNGQIDNDFTIPDVGATTLSFFITANRVLLIAHEPQLPVTETWAWLTSLIQAADGTEQRIAVRHLPKQTIIYEYQFDDERVNVRLEMFLRVFGKQRLAIPWWLDRTTLTQVVNVNDTVLNVVSTVDKDFRTGSEQGAVVVLDTDENFEANEVLTIGTTSLTLVNKMLNTWPVGTDVYPVRTGFLRDNWKQELGSINMRAFTLQFDVISGRDYGDESSFPTYKGSKVFTDMLGLESNTYNRSWDSRMIETGGPVSISSRRTLRRFPLVETEFLLPWSSKTEFVAARNWLMARRGQQKDFWMTSRRVDFQVQQDLGAGALVRVFPANYKNVFDDGQYIDIAIFYADDTVDYREVIAVISTVTYEEIQVDSSFSQTPTQANIDHIEMLIKHRLAQDISAFRHDYTTGGDVKVVIVEIVD